MTERLKEIFSNLPSCDTFADIGCDHGYIAKAMLESGKCKRAIVSDISAKCLSKAEALLSENIKNGSAQSVVSDGFDKISFCDLALIAGMGGEEIVSILSSAKSLPKTLVLQPMKNTDKVRVRAVELGYAIKKDYLFNCGRIFYDLIILESGKDCLTQEEIEFGRTNLQTKSQVFEKYLQRKIGVLAKCQKNKGLSQEVCQKMQNEIERLEKYVKP